MALYRGWGEKLIEYTNKESFAIILGLKYSTAIFCLLILWKPFHLKDYNGHSFLIMRQCDLFAGNVLSKSNISLMRTVASRGKLPIQGSFPRSRCFPKHRKIVSGNRHLPELVRRYKNYGATFEFNSMGSS